ncbi:hypothetical protein BURMUCGD1_5881 [Burkholderia multivorans CGD1]|nr:hypothetical protein BURMUCGD1_5881 [Burkholderia multivorans CGD1]
MLKTLRNKGLPKLISNCYRNSPSTLSIQRISQKYWMATFPATRFDAMGKNISSIPQKNQAPKVKAGEGLPISSS